MAKITLKDIIQGQKIKEVKSYNSDLFKSDSENVTQDFNKNDWDYLTLLSTDTDTKTGLLKETILGIQGQDAYLINTQPSSYNGEVTVSIYQKWLTLQGLNFFIKENDNFYDEEGHLTEEIKDYYSKVLSNEYNLDITYQDVIELGEYNSEFNCVILSFKVEDNNYYITINERQQLSKVTIKKTALPKTANIVKIKSILA